MIQHVGLSSQHVNRSNRGGSDVSKGKPHVSLGARIISYALLGTRVGSRKSQGAPHPRPSAAAAKRSVSWALVSSDALQADGMTEKRRLQNTKQARERSRRLGERLRRATCSLNVEKGWARRRRDCTSVSPRLAQCLFQGFATNPFSCAMWTPAARMCQNLQLREQEDCAWRIHDAHYRSVSRVAPACECESSRSLRGI